MTEFKVGDRVRSTMSNGDVAEFTVVATSEEFIESEYNVYHFKHANFELIERPYALPTEPGLYQATPSFSSNVSPSISYRIFQLWDTGVWEEFGKGRENDVAGYLTRFKMPLTRLVFEE